MPFRRVSREVLATGAFLSFDQIEIEGPAGNRATRFMLSHPGAVAFLPVHDSEVLLMRQYRGPVDEELLEVPAGKLEPGESDLRAAVVRECVEEVGMYPTTITSLGHMFTSGGITDERIDLFFVTDLQPVESKPDGLEEEHATILRLPVADLPRLVASGELTDGKSIATITRFLLRDGA